MQRYTLSFVVIDFFLSSTTALARFGFRGDPREAWVVFGILVWLLIAPSLYIVTMLAKWSDPEVIMALNMRSIEPLKEEPVRDEAPIIVNAGGGEYQRLCGHSLVKWVRVSKKLFNNSYRVRARTLGDDYEWFRGAVENNPDISIMSGKSINLTEKGKSVIRQLAHYPTGKRQADKHVFQRLTHT